MTRTNPATGAKIEVTWKDLTFWESKTWKVIKANLEKNPDFIPGPKKIFRAMSLTPFHKVRVVILGQDPYPTPGDADGLAFSSARVDKAPRSLQNIFMELHNDVHVSIPHARFTLDNWAREGVFLWNVYPTTMPHEDLGHDNWGWEELTTEIIQMISAFLPNPVFVFWGNKAQEYEQYTDGNFCIKSAHPSPLSAKRGFFGSRPFSQVNQYLTDCGEKGIDWRL